MRLARTAAMYLKKLPESEYAIPSTIANAINYALDSGFKKLDDIKNANHITEKWYPSDPHSHIKSLWLQCELHTAVTLNQSFPAVFKDLNVWAFSRLFVGDQANYRIVPFLDMYEFKDLLSGNYRYQVQSSQICIAPNTCVTLPIYGNFFIEHIGTGAHLFVTADFCYEGIGCSILVMACPENQKSAEQFINDMHASIIANDIYHCKCLSYIKGRLDFTSVSPTSWDSIILKDKIKENIRQNTIEVLKNSEKLIGLGMCPNSNVLLASPPGMAKTKLFRAISDEVVGDMTVIWCTGKSIEYAEHVTSLFQAARMLAPCIIFIEDLDLHAGDRSSLSGDSGRVLNEFLACLDGAQENTGVVVMASTNNISSIDEALTDRPGRFDVKLEIPLPDVEDRSDMLKVFLSEYHAMPDKSVTNDAWTNIINLTEGMTGAYVRLLAKSTVLHAVSRGQSNSNVCTFTCDDMNTAAEQVMKGFAIGKRARKHHKYEVEVDKA